MTHDMEKLTPEQAAERLLHTGGELDELFDEIGASWRTVPLWWLDEFDKLALECMSCSVWTPADKADKSCPDHIRCPDCARMEGEW